MIVPCPRDSPVRERREEHHMLLHDSIQRLAGEKLLAQYEIQTLKARIVRLELKLYPIIKETHCGR